LHGFLRVMEWVPLSTSKDVDRFADIIRAAVCSGAVKGFAKFEKSLYVGHTSVLFFVVSDTSRDATPLCLHRSTLNIDDNSEAAEVWTIWVSTGSRSPFLASYVCC